MVGPKKPDPETGLPLEAVKPLNNDERYAWNGQHNGKYRYHRGRNAVGWCRRKRGIHGNYLRDQASESGETYEKELASAERMKRGYFKK